MGRKRVEKEEKTRNGRKIDKRDEKLRGTEGKKKMISS